MGSGSVGKMSKQDKIKAMEMQLKALEEGSQGQDFQVVMPKTGSTNNVANNTSAIVRNSTSSSRVHHKKPYERTNR